MLLQFFQVNSTCTRFPYQEKILLSTTQLFFGLLSGNYPPRPQYPPGAYATGPPPPPTSQAGAGGANSMPSGAQAGGYPGRGMPNHTGQYPPYQWVPPSPQQTVPGGAPGGAMVGNHVQGKGTPPPPVVGGPPPPQGSGSPRPLNYLKQHLQHKGGYGGSPTPPQGPQGYGNGPTGMHPGMPMGPPHHMGPPHGPTNMGPPTSTPPQSQMLQGGQPQGQGASGGPESGGPEHISQDNGISSSGPTGAAGMHAVTSVVTTGPDGTSMDEVSQQSTLSNASAGELSWDIRF